MITEEQYENACQQKNDAEKILRQYHEQRMEKFKDRWDNFNINHKYFTDDELRYSAYTTCKKCGAGMAYPKDCPSNHQWTCSNVLKGIGTDSGHDAFSFFMYDIKSEDQPSAKGATTRPKII